MCTHNYTYKLINGTLHIPFNPLTPNHRDSRDGYFMQFIVSNGLL